ncbi:MAG: DUF4097 family beta strand repeat-containing protein [Acidobacteriota bacterium]
MKKKFTLLFILIFFSLSFFTFGYKYEKTIEKSFKAGQNFSFKIENCNGNIDIVTHKGDTIYVKAKKYSNKEDHFEETKVVFNEENNNLKIYVKRPWRNCKASVKFFIKLPQSISLSEIETVNGSIEIEGSLKDLDAETVNGRLSIEGAFEDAELSTVNGSVNIYQKKALAGDLSVKTVNGSVKLEIDKSSSFNLRAGTVNGSIKSDFNLHRAKRFIGSKMDGTVNKGKYDIKLKTVNGSIKILSN